VSRVIQTILFAFVFPAVFATSSGLIPHGRNSEARAQLFGERNLGGGLTRNQGPSPAVGRGGGGSGMEFRSVDPERFVRGQRRADSFVGGAQMEPGSDFVGREIPTQTGAIRSAIDGTLPRQPARRASRINRPLTPTPRNMVGAPRFAIGADSFSTSEPQRADGDLFATREEQLTDVLVRRVSPDVAVRLENRRAILEGTVNSDHGRRLAEIMLGFEPGIDEVVNRLEVTSP
jgi:hypothetical protein